MRPFGRWHLGNAPPLLQTKARIYDQRLIVSTDGIGPQEKGSWSWEGSGLETDTVLMLVK